MVIKKNKITFASFFAHFLLVPRKPVLVQRVTTLEPAKGGTGWNHSDRLKFKKKLSHHEKTISYSG